MAALTSLGISSLGISPEVLILALELFFDLKPVHLVLITFGSLVAILLSLVAIWKTVARGRGI